MDSSDDEEDDEKDGKEFEQDQESGESTREQEAKCVTVVTEHRLCVRVSLLHVMTVAGIMSV